MKRLDEVKITTGKAARILVVDDERSIAKLFSLYLARNGYDVAVADSGAQTLEKLSGSEKFDLIVLDLALGEINGVDILPQIAEIDPNLPVIIVTGLGFDEELVQEAKKLGVAGFITKALPLSQLLMEVRRALSASR